MLYADRTHGCWAVWLFGYGVLLKAPRCHAPFSERNGHARRIPLGRGWRLIFRRQYG